MGTDGGREGGRDTGRVGLNTPTNVWMLLTQICRQSGQSQACLESACPALTKSSSLSAAPLRQGAPALMPDLALLCCIHSLLRVFLSFASAFCSCSAVQCLFHVSKAGFLGSCMGQDAQWTSL